MSAELAIVIGGGAVIVLLIWAETRKYKRRGTIIRKGPVVDLVMKGELPTDVCSKCGLERRDHLDGVAHEFVEPS